jgi:3-deoxy-manno-octulosonate cytidylyltransferase (CMP-KDO synthetase)
VPFHIIGNTTTSYFSDRTCRYPSVLAFAVHPETFKNPFKRTSQPLRTVVLIPARYGSSRFPGKALANLAGRPLIEHVYRRAAAAQRVDAVGVATDDARIAAAVTAFGGHVVMTSSTHQSGSDRIAEAAANIECEIVVNVQGDEPLIEPAAIDAAIEPLLADAELPMTTLSSPIHDLADVSNANVVKVVTDIHGNALYFSRSLIPYPGRQGSKPLRHIGIYAYRRLFLLEFTKWAPTPLELVESLEQLRVLEHGFRIRTIHTTHDFIGVDTPEDLTRAHELVSRRINEIT